MAYQGVPKSEKLYERAQQIMPGGTQLFSRRADRFVPGWTPMFIARAEGAKLWDIDGNEYVDFGMGCGPVILGHAYPAVVEAVEEQLRRGNCHTVNSPIEVELAELLIDVVPCAEMVRYAKCGGEINTVALRIARGYTGRDKVAFCGYHGWHDWYLSANLSSSDALNAHLLPGLDTRGVPRCLEGTAIPFEFNNLDSLKGVLDANRGEIACIIMEACRTQSPEPGYLESVKELAHQHGAVLIFDEIVTGFRMTLGGAQEYFGVTPDLATFAKALSNGIPVAAVCGSEEIMSEAAGMFISSTYFSDTLGIAAAIATIKELRDRPVFEHIWRLGKRLQDGLNALGAKYGVPFHSAGQAPFQHPGFVHDDEETRVLMNTIFLQELTRGGILGTTVIYMSYSHTEDDVQAYLRAAEVATEKVARGLEEGDLGKYCEAGLCGQSFRRLV